MTKKTFSILFYSKAFMAAWNASYDDKISLASLECHVWRDRC